MVNMNYILPICLLSTMAVLRIITWNIRGTLNCLTQVTSKLDSCDIMFVNEHWLNELNISQLSDLHNDFKVFFKCQQDHSSQRGAGGVALFIRKTITCSPLYVISSDHIIGAKLVMHGNTTYIIGTRLPSSNVLDSIYYEELYNTLDLYDTYSQQGETILFGDFNADLRHCTSLKGRAKCLRRALDERNLISVVPLDDNTICTYSSKCKTFKSMIDYVFIDREYRSNVLGYAIDKNITFSVSDHLPILAVFNADLRSRNYGDANLNWRKANSTDLMMFRYETENYFRTDPLSAPQFPSHEQYIESYYDFIVESLHASACTSIPTSKFQPHLKPYWKSDNLKEPHDEMRQSRREWVLNGKTHDKDDAYYIKYKEAKRIFRKQHRKSKKTLEDKKFREISEASEISIQEFFRVTKRYKRKRERVNGLSYDNESCDTQEGICELFAKYFRDLSVPSSDDSYDVNFTDYVNNHVQEQLEDELRNQHVDDKVSSQLLCPFTYDELLGAIKRLKNGKAPGPDGVVNEHLKCSGRSIINHLVTLYNDIVSYEYCPVSFSIGKILPIHKGKGKSKDDPSNYRGITLTSVLSKLFDRLLLNRIEVWASNSKGFPHQFQFGFRKGAGAETAALTLLESIAYYNERNSPVYCVFLDNEKAFDRIWLNGLFYKLYNFGIKGKLWRLIRTIYSSMQSCVSFGGYTSGTFRVEQGVGQGRVLSAWLFSLYINDLLCSLNTLQRGLCLPWGDTPGILLADDTTLVSASPDGIQCLLNASRDYASRWHLRYNANKSVFLLFGNANRNISPHLYIGTQLIRQSDSVIYAGLFLSTASTTLERTKIACQKLRMLISANHCNGLFFGGIDPLSACQIWKRVLLPCGMFACDVWCKLSAKEYEMLEVVQNYFCKKIQGLSKRASSVIARDSLDLMPIQSYIEQRVLLLFGRVCNTDIDFVFKRILHYRLAQFHNDSNAERFHKCKRSPIYHMLHLATKYDLNNDIDLLFQTSVFVNKRKWTSRVKDKISKSDAINIDSTFQSRETLSRYALIRAPNIHRLWRMVFERPDLFYDIAFLFYVSTLRMQSKECICGIFAYDIVKHVFIHCKYTESQRDSMFDSIIDILDVNTFCSLWEKDDDVFIAFLLGGLPTDCTHDLSHELWAKCIVNTSQTVKSWKKCFYGCY